MYELLVYTLKSAFVLTLLYLPYTLMLRHERFFRLNRLTLLSILVLALVQPLCKFTSPDGLAQMGDAATAITHTQELVYQTETFITSHPVSTSEVSDTLDWRIWIAFIYIIGGLAALIFGGNIFVDGATGIARSLGVSESVIGLTLVAGGTSLPELATSVVAALKKNPEMAIGNVVGSNLFNIFLVLGASATITPLNLIGITNFDLLSLVIASVILWFFGVFYKKRTITRIEGTFLVVCYIAYTTALILMS